MLAARGIIAGRGPRRAARRARPGGARAAPTARSRSPPGDEDIHMAIERRLTEIVGPVGGQAAHGPLAQRPGRRPTWRCSRARARAAAPAAIAAADGRTLLERAEEHVDWPMPGYTHLQRAQPVYLGHHLLAYFWMLAPRPRALRVAERGVPARCRSARARSRASTSTPIAQLVARELGFSRRGARTRSTRSPNRDFVLDYLGRRRDLLDPPLPAGRRARAVVQRGVRLLRAARRVELGLLDHAAEEEPRRRRAAAREGAARRRPPGGLPRRDARRCR